ncbi:MAG: hypothetical protein KBF88_11970 [Polyangiaceae bacterium]|nr:hypothetical protein [Polyangiaceae bacterium]
MNKTNLLAFDSIGGLLVGPLVLAFREPLSGLERLPTKLLVATGVANVVYGLYSGQLALRSKRGTGISRAELHLLVVANACWAVFCFVTAFSLRAQASWWGLAHLVGEGIYVGLLAWVERRVLLA